MLSLASSSVWEGRGFRCMHIRSKMRTGRFPESPGHPFMKSLIHGPNTETLILQEVSHPQVWFWSSLVRTQLLHALKFCHNTRKIWTSHYDFFRIWEIVAQRRQNWKEMTEEEKAVRCYWPLKKFWVELLSRPQSLSGKSNAVSARADMWKWERVR